MTPFHVALLSFTGGTLLTTGLFIWIESRGKQFQALNQSQTEVISQLSSIHGKIEAGKIDIQKNLTNTDLLNVAWSQEYLEKNGELLCREMFCRLQTREGDGASQTECEEVSNLNNSLVILEECSKLGLETKDCISVVERRK